jgi:subtilisin family serine protease
MATAGGHTEAHAAASRMPFSGSTGKGLKIAVIDSGVHVSHPHIIATTRGFSLEQQSEAPESWNDSLGHGTAVTAAIQEKAPGAEYYAVKLFDKSLSASSARLLAAMEWCIGQQVDLINLSLGTPNLSFRSAFESSVKRAVKAGILMICARRENEKPVLPGILEGLISVDVDWRLPRHSYSLAVDEVGSHYLASGFPRPLPGVSPTKNLSGISFAVANMTGLVARACEHLDVRNLENVHNLLASQAFHYGE